MIGTCPVPAQGPADIVIYRSRLNARINGNFEVFTATDSLAAITQHITDKDKKLLLERHVYSHRCHRVRQTPAERHGIALTAPPLKGCGMQNAIQSRS